MSCHGVRISNVEKHFPEAFWYKQLGHYHASFSQLTLYKKSLIIVKWGKVGASPARTLCPSNTTTWWNTFFRVLSSQTSYHLSCLWLSRELQAAAVLSNVVAGWVEFCKWAGRCTLSLCPESKTYDLLPGGWHRSNSWSDALYPLWRFSQQLGDKLF